MRYLAIMPVLVLMACAGPQQTAGVNDFDAPTKAEVVIIETDASADELYKRLASDLSQRGYTFNHSDATLRSLSTDWRNYQAYDVRMSVSVNEEGRALLRGWWRMLGVIGETPITKIGAEGSVPRRAWAHLHEIADAMNGMIAYE